MPEVEYTTTVNLPREKVWDFVKDMNNWAPFLTGYQKHEILNDTDSIWTLKGDVGVLAIGEEGGVEKTGGSGDIVDHAAAVEGGRAGGAEDVLGLVKLAAVRLTPA